MGSVNNRRLYAAGLAIATVGFVLDRTLFSESGAGPAAAKAELAPGAEAAAKEKPATGQHEPSQAAISALVAKLKSLEESRPVGPPPLRDVFSLYEDPSEPDAVAPANKADSATKTTADDFKATHRLRSVMVFGKDSTPGAGVPLLARVVLTRTGDNADAYDRIPLNVGEALDGYTLLSVSGDDGGSATFANGSSRVVLIVPKALAKPKSGGN